MMANNGYLLEDTGERYLPWTGDCQISYEHLHRYRFAQEFVQGKKVLDLGCGEGYGPHLISERASLTIGVDQDYTIIRHATHNYRRDNLFFIQGSMLEVPLKDGLFDVVICFEALEHITAHRELIREVKRLLNRDGLFIISTPNREVLYQEEPGYTNPYHLRELSLEEFYTLLSGGFNQVVLFGQKVYPCSFIFPLQEGEDMSHRDFFIDRRGDKRFQFVSQDRGQARYLIALATDSPSLSTDSQIGSVLFDLSDGFNEEKRSTLERVRELEGRLREKDQVIALISQRLDGYLAELRRVSATVEKIKRALPHLHNLLAGLQRGEITAGLLLEASRLCQELGLLKSAEEFKYRSQEGLGR